MNDSSTYASLQPHLNKTINDSKQPINDYSTYAGDRHGGIGESRL